MKSFGVKNVKNATNKINQNNGYKAIILIYFVWVSVIRLRCLIYSFPKHALYKCETNY